MNAWQVYPNAFVHMFQMISYKVIGWNDQSDFDYLNKFYKGKFLQIFARVQY